MCIACLKSPKNEKGSVDGLYFNKSVLSTDQKINELKEEIAHILIRTCLENSIKMYWEKYSEYMTTSTTIKEILK